MLDGLWLDITFDVCGDTSRYVLDAVEVCMVQKLKCPNLIFLSASNCSNDIRGDCLTVLLLDVQLVDRISGADFTC